MNTSINPIRPVAERNALAVSHLHIVGVVVARLWRVESVRRLGRDEAHSVGVLGLLQAADRWDPNVAAFPTVAYLFITRHVLDAARHLGRRRTVRLTDCAADRVPDRGPDPCTLAERSDEAASVHAALAGLTDRQRYSLTLRYFDGLTQREAGQRLGKPAWVVKGDQRAALAALRLALALGRPRANDAAPVECPPGPFRCATPPPLGATGRPARRPGIGTLRTAAAGGGTSRPAR